MNEEMMAYCGTYCETCDWKEKMNCKGCKKHEGKVFWGNCAIAECARSKDLSHCGECEDMPCEKLKDAYNNKDHGDNGERLANLIKWSNNEISTLKVRS